MRVFVTVGNAIQPFERMLRAVDTVVRIHDGALEGVCQCGSSRTEPRGLRTARSLPRPEFDTEIGVADIVITHGGVGSIYTALRQGHTPIVFPRRVRLGEHVNDHQVEMAQKLAEQGRVVLAEDSGTLAAQIDRFFRLQLRRRAAPTGDEDLQPIARALAEGKPAGWRWTVRAHVLVRVLAAFAPKLEQLRMDGKPDAPDGV